MRMREKLSKAKPRDIKGVVCRGLPWVCFGQRFYLSDLDELRSQLSCHSTLSLTQVECSQHQDSATARPTDLDPRRSRLMRAAFCFCRSPDAHLTQRSRGHEHTFVNSSWKNPYQPQPESQSQTPLRCLHRPD